MTAVEVSPVKNEAGFSLIDMLFVVALIGLLATLAIPGLMRARGAAQSASALGTLRVVNSAQLSYAITCGLGFYSPDFPTLAIKPPGAVEAFLPQELASGPTFIKAGYNFSMAGTSLPGAPATCNGLGAGNPRPAMRSWPTSSTLRVRGGSSERMPTVSSMKTRRVWAARCPKRARRRRGIQSNSHR